MERSFKNFITNIKGVSIRGCFSRKTFSEDDPGYFGLNLLISDVNVDLGDLPSKLIKVKGTSNFIHTSVQFEDSKYFEDGIVFHENGIWDIDKLLLERAPGLSKINLKNIKERDLKSYKKVDYFLGRKLVAESYESIECDSSSGKGWVQVNAVCNVYKKDAWESSITHTLVGEELRSVNHAISEAKKYMTYNKFKSYKFGVNNYLVGYFKSDYSNSPDPTIGESSKNYRITFREGTEKKFSIKVSEEEYKNIYDYAEPNDDWETWNMDKFILNKTHKLDDKEKEESE